MIAGRVTAFGLRLPRVRSRVKFDAIIYREKVSRSLESRICRVVDFAANVRQGNMYQNDINSIAGMELPIRYLLTPFYFSNSLYSPAVLILCHRV